MESRLAKLSVVMTFALLLIGGTVNPTGSSLACPEASIICHGSYLPPMHGGVLYEHGHRLWAQAVGLLQLVITILVWRRRPPLRRLVGAALAMITVQAALGAITVHYKLPWAVSTFHLLLGFVYFATTCVQAWALRAPRPVAAPRVDLGRTRIYIGVALAFVFLQTLLGGLVRHHEAALACIDLPLCAGTLYPPGAPMNLIIHMTHRLGGAITGIAVLTCAIAVWRSSRGVRSLRIMAALAPVLVAAQIALGLLTVYTLRSTPVAVAHFGGAAALWALWIAMWLVAREHRMAPSAQAVHDQALRPALEGA
ncbi:MAG TPA: COX15/CtaA family protein [Kofleriaceae bacterium]|nr:COX15/CtaA family protein [Kofleriaceae bacterium]